MNANRPTRGLEIGAVYRFGDHKTGRPDLEFVDGKKIGSITPIVQMNQIVV